jgi:hypothetical protein
MPNRQARKPGHLTEGHLATLTEASANHVDHWHVSSWAV